MEGTNSSINISKPARICTESSWPSASIREFIAIHSERKHLIIFILGWLVSLIPFYLLLAEMSR